MAQINPPGYPLPDGELGEDEIVCQLVYLPDRPEYWQALLAAIHYFSTWKAWERDDDKRGQDAAANWRDAFELTIGCWRMTCLEELTETVTDILELLQTKKDCCDDNITYDIVDEIETDIIPFEGDAPELYGETEIADWDEWAEHVCYNAHLYVDYLAHAGDTIWEAAKLSAITIGVIAAVLATLFTLGIGAPVAWTLVAALTSGIFLGGTKATFAGSHDAIEAARDDIVCAIINGTGVAAAVELALESGLDWDLFYSWIPYNSAMAIVYEGGHDSEFLSAETREDCDCEVEAEFKEVWLWTADIESPWRLVDDAEWVSGAIVMGGNASLEAWAGEMRVYLGLGSTGSISISRLWFRYKRSTASGSPRVRIIHDGGTFSWVYDDVPVASIYEFEEIFDPPLVVTHPQNPFITFEDSLPGNIVRNYDVALDMDAE